MWRLHARKVNVLNRGGPANVLGCNITHDGRRKSNGRKSAEVIVASERM